MPVQNVDSEVRDRFGQVFFRDRIGLKGSPTGIFQVFARVYFL